MAPLYGTQKWHHVHSPKVGRHPPLWHPAMAPSNGTTSTTPKLVVTLPSNTLQWHPAMAAHPLPKVGRHPPLWIPAMAPSNGTQQRHHVHSPKVGHHPPPPIAHYNGTLQWHHVHSPKPPPQPWHTTMAPHDSTQQWHHVLCTLQWHPGATSNPPKWFVALPPYWK